MAPTSPRPADPEPSATRPHMPGFGIVEREGELTTTATRWEVPHRDHEEADRW